MAVVGVLDQAKRTANVRPIPLSRQGDKLSELKMVRDVALAYRSQFETNWRMNGAYLQGRQWIRFDRGHNTIVDEQPARRTNRVLATLNLTRALLLARIGQRVRASGDWTVVPATADQHDVAQAKSDEQFLRYIQRANGMRAKRARTAAWTVVTGTGAMKTGWDKNVGPVEQIARLDKDGNPVIEKPCVLCNGSGAFLPLGGEALASDPMAMLLAPVCPECKGTGGELATDAKHLGELTITPISPYALLLDPGVSDPDNGEFVIEIQELSVQQAQREYADSGATDLFLSAAESLPSRGDMAGMRATRYSSVTVYTMYERPTTKHKNGRVYVFTDTFMVDEFDWPYPQAGWHPFTFYTDYPRLNHPYGMSCADDMRNIQRMINRLISQIMEHGNIVTNPILRRALDAVTGGLHDGYPQPGRILEFNPFAAPPDWMQPPQMQAHPIELLRTLMTALRDIAGISETPAASKLSGRTLAFLQELEDKVNTFQHELQNEADRQLAVKAITIASEHYGRDRMFAVLGEGNQVAYYTLKPAHDRNSPVDVYVDVGDPFPDSKVAKMEMVMQMLPLWKGADGQPDTKYALRKLDSGHPELDRDRKERENAIAENDRIAKGEFVEAMQHERHTVHIEEHDEWLFEHAEQRNSPAFQAVLQHRAQHDQIAVALQMRSVQLSAAQIAGGSTNGGPAAAQTTGAATAHPDARPPDESGGRELEPQQMGNAVAPSSVDARVQGADRRAEENTRARLGSGSSS